LWIKLEQVCEVLRKPLKAMAILLPESVDKPVVGAKVGT
jgi:hypothetical protein